MTIEALNREFEAARPQLRAYLLRMTAHQEDTEDLVQETYIKAHRGLSSFAGDSSLKTWIFAIGSNLTRDYLRARKRWPENVTDICKTAALQDQAFFGEQMRIRQSSPQGQFEIKEHIVFCFTCIGKSLPLEQQIVILLKEVYGFTTKEIAIIIDNNEAMVKYYLRVGRAKMIEIFDRRCSLINKEGVCHQCTELNGIFNPHQKAAEEVAKLAMAKAAEKGDKEELFDLRLQLVKSIDPYDSDAAELQLHHLQHNRKVMEKYLEKD
ncbi:MAG: RNA polymerase sigma factor [Bacteroidota bacterium]